MKIPSISFPTDFNSIWQRIEAIDPYKYAKTRNFIWGAVTYLSPYISRGVISVDDVRKVVLSKVDSPWEIEKFLQELAWREYWQRIWLDKGDAIFSSLRNKQERLRKDITGSTIPSAVNRSETGISALDIGIEHLQNSGYMHNHLRMYLASLWTNIGGYAWQDGAKWMHYHLLDGDLASNWLSWQWVCGTNSSKLYYCNQENINKYCGTKDEGTILDLSYEELSKNPFSAPDVMNDCDPLVFPESPNFRGVDVITRREELTHLGEEKIFLYHWYHLDPRWMTDEVGTRILLIEPSYFKKFPVSDVVWNFVLALAQEIPSIKVVYCEFQELKSWCPDSTFITREHPIVSHWEAQKCARPWMSVHATATGSFFNFWKKASREIMEKG
jgi:deoxyribodipyrimidine photo-lyase